MANLQSPGVYVDEVPSAIKPIAGAGTSTTGFLAVMDGTVYVPSKADSTKFIAVTLPPVNQPMMFTNWTQFVTAYGDFTMPGTGVASQSVSADRTRLAHAIFGFFTNGGTRCYVVRSADTTGVAAALNTLAAISEIALVAAPGRTDDVVRNALIDHCNAAPGRFAILDGPSTVTSMNLLITPPSGSGSNDATQDANADPKTLKAKPALRAGDGGGGVMPRKSDLAAWYFPWVNVLDPTTGTVAAMPASGHIAGIYGRVDATRGVHKAPANEPILGVIGLSQPVSKADQDVVNLKGCNCLREMNGDFVVWGARTSGGDDNQDLKYISVRRTLLFLRTSLEQGTQWIVFEPNTPALWQKITRNVDAFLTNIWRAGALFGETKQQAFYIKCDAENNPDSQRDLGQVTIEIGVALVRPAEFVVFKISQWSAPSS